MRNCVKEAGLVLSALCYCCVVRLGAPSFTWYLEYFVHGKVEEARLGAEIFAMDPKPRLQARIKIQIWLNSQRRGGDLTRVLRHAREPDLLQQYCLDCGEAIIPRMLKNGLHLVYTS